MASIPSSGSGESFLVEWERTHHQTLADFTRALDLMVNVATWAQTCYICQRGRAWPAQPVWFHRFMWEHSRGIARRLPGA